MFAESDVKARIAQQFSKAASRYDELARVQWQIAQSALLMHTNTGGIVMDLGCGTGRASSQLAKTADQVLGLDIAGGMVELARQRCPLQNTHFTVADAEYLPLGEACIDSVFSSMALQWCQPLDKVLSELFRVMKTGGRGTLAIMVQGSLTELNQSWQVLGESAHINTFESLNTMCTAAISAGFICNPLQQRFTSWHKDVFDVLHSIKDIGAGVLLEQNASHLSRKQLRQLDKIYAEKHAQHKGLPLSYEVGFLRLEKQ
ncbi:methyltransferase domain-containing protein [Lacimicrobium alkaliphilum]|uniref:Biotin synthesis protein BioC n=1 Tax=Lacimicrobium alkaliphilum TaxID=1526571 RepID=A0ABQ1R2X2_9ALTE|nr:methyltransferase domain-containing protein [Lacimicrobium alkaliphilum]GGD52973.1 biotin synthesis protein BioC [Lacimicrobium alkaliphilum]